MRPNNFDLLRLLAALQVIYCHTTWHLDITTGLGDPALIKVINWFPGLPMFFTLSGFLISRSWERNHDLRDYATKRALRIFPALWFQLAMGILLVVALGKLAPHVLATPSFFLWLAAQCSFVQFYNPTFLRGFGTGVLNGSLWTISIEIGFYVLLPLFYASFINRLSRFRADLCLALLALGSFGYWFYLSHAGYHANKLAMLQMVTPIPHLFMFLIGVLFQRNFERVRTYLENRFGYWLIGFTTYMFLLEPWGHNMLSTSPLAVLGGRVLMATMIFSFAFSWRSLSERLLRGQDISYGMYLYHGLLINTCVEFGWKGNSMALAGVVLFSTVLALLSWYLIERPALQLRPDRSLTVSEPVLLPLPTNAVAVPLTAERRAA